MFVPQFTTLALIKVEQRYSFFQTLSFRMWDWFKISERYEKLEVFLLIQCLFGQSRAIVDLIHSRSITIYDFYSISTKRIRDSCLKYGFGGGGTARSGGISCQHSKFRWQNHDCNKKLFAKSLGRCMSKEARRKWSST